MEGAKPKLRKTKSNPNAVEKPEKRKVTFSLSWLRSKSTVETQKEVKAEEPVSVSNSNLSGG